MAATPVASSRGRPSEPRRADSTSRETSQSGRPHSPAPLIPLGLLYSPAPLIPRACLWLAPHGPSIDEALESACSPFPPSPCLHHFQDPFKAAEASRDSFRSNLAPPLSGPLSRPPRRAETPSARTLAPHGTREDSDSLLPRHTRAHCRVAPARSGRFILRQATALPRPRGVALVRGGGGAQRHARQERRRASRER